MMTTITAQMLARPTRFSGLRNQLRLYWTEALPYQRHLYWLGVLLILSGLVHIIPLVATGGDLSGPVSFRKPIVFGWSTGLTLIFTTWVMTYMPRFQRLGNWLNRTIGYLLLLEVVLIDMQTWRGVPSHFNFSTPFNAAVFSTMGSAIAVVGFAIILITLLSFFPTDAPASIIWAIRIGLLLLVVSQVFGNLIVANGVPKVIDMETGAFIMTAETPYNVYDPKGIMKLPHFFAMHGIQVVPVLAVLGLFTGWSARRRFVWMLVGAAGYTGITTVVSVLTFTGRGPFDFDPVSGSVALLSIGALAAAYAWTWLNLLHEEV